MGASWGFGAIHHCGTHDLHDALHDALPQHARAGAGGTVYALWRGTRQGWHHVPSSGNMNVCSAMPARLPACVDKGSTRGAARCLSVLDETPHDVAASRDCTGLQQLRHAGRRRAGPARVKTARACNSCCTQAQPLVCQHTDCAHCTRTSMPNAAHAGSTRKGANQGILEERRMRR